MHEYADDPTIGDDEELWRRIPPLWVIHDDTRGGWRPTSQAFHDHPDGSPMSVFLASVMLAAQRPPTDAIHGHEHKDFHLASISAGFARSLDQLVVRDPQEDEPAHGSVVGQKKKACRKLAKAATWVIPPRAGFKLGETD